MQVKSLLLLTFSLEGKIKRTFALTIVIVAVAFVPILATIINVPDDYPTIQEGIDASNNGDTVLVADGTYTGEGNRNIDFVGKLILLKSIISPYG